MSKVTTGGIYFASKATAHGPRWRQLRDEGWPVISSWIDESEPGQTTDWADLWQRCIQETQRCDVFIYREPGEVLKGALLELGVALSLCKPVYAVGMEDYTFARSNLFRNYDTLSAALSHAVFDLRNSPGLDRKKLAQSIAAMAEPRFSLKRKPPPESSTSRFLADLHAQPRDLLE